METATHGLIRDMISAETIRKVDAPTPLILVNALYFKAAWSKEFSDSKTRKKPFHVSPQIVKQVRNPNRAFSGQLVPSLFLVKAAFLRWHAITGSVRAQRKQKAIIYHRYALKVNVFT